MTKRELVEKVKKLLAKNKTEEALQLLSRAQLSENDKTVVILMAQMSRLQQDSLINQITTEEKNRIQDSINKAILDLSEKINPEEINLEKINFNEDGKKSPDSLVAPVIPMKLVDSHSESNISSFRFNPKNRQYLIIILIIPLTILVALSRFGKSTKKDSTSVIVNTPKDSTPIVPTQATQLLKAPESAWKQTQLIYSEDFKNHNAPNFRSDIWNYVPNNNKYWLGVENEEYYSIKIKSPDIKSRHKYLGNFEYDASRDLIAYKSMIKINESKNCLSKKNCLGRGISINYNSNSKSSYAFIVNDAGQVHFLKLPNFKNPENKEVLFTKEMSLDNKGQVELGIVHYSNLYFLFVNSQLIKKLEVEDPLDGKYCGVIVIGNGNHSFDTVELRKL